MEHSWETVGKQFLCFTALLAVTVSSIGCQVDVAGQTLPSPYYRSDDIQYFEEGPEFKLQNEADAMKAYRAQKQLGDRQ